MKVYEVECRAVITVTAEDMQKAALYGEAVIKDNTHLIYVRAVHERDLNRTADGPRHDVLVQGHRFHVQVNIERRQLDRLRYGQLY
jgi:hypothetical protein